MKTFAASILSTAVLVNTMCRANLVWPTGPHEGKQAVYRLASQSLNGQPLNCSRCGDLRIKMCREYSVEPDDVASGRMISAAKGGWRYLIFDGTNAIGSAHCIRTNQESSSIRCTDIGTDTDPVNALSIAAKLPQIRSKDYEVRFIKASLFRGLWLHATSDDILIPVNTGFGDWPTDQPVDEKRILAIIQPYEQQQIPLRKEWRNAFETMQ